MKTYNNLYSELCSLGNLIIAWRKARKGKTKRQDVIEFEKNVEKNLFELHYELKFGEYKPRPLKTFILRDPKTRVISKSDFRDRIVHHALINIIGRIFESRFIYDSCANQKDKGNLFALRRFELYKRKVSKNFSSSAFYLKADIKHYFYEIDLRILLSLIEKRIKDKNVMGLIKKILFYEKKGESICKGMPLGNLTSQFFANVYLNELDYFVKNKLKAKYYVRYVDDFIILHKSAKQLHFWKEEINNFLTHFLHIELHPEKSMIVSLYRGTDFVGFRLYEFHKLLRKRNIVSIEKKINLFKDREVGFRYIIDILNGWEAYAIWANSYNLRRKIKYKIIESIFSAV